METGLAGKVVLITGATRNHGRASALAFAEEGDYEAAQQAFDQALAIAQREGDTDLEMWGTLPPKKQFPALTTRNCYEG